jgi:hypothetical protein
MYRQSGHGGSFHGPHAPAPETFQLQLMASHTLPPRINPATVCSQPAIGPISRPTITEIYSDPEEDEKTSSQSKGTLECLADPRREPIEVREQNSYHTNSYDDTTLRPRQRGRENKQSRMARALEQLQPVSEPLLQTAGGQASAGDQKEPSMSQCHTTKTSSKERNSWKRFFPFGKSKSKQKSGLSFTWKLRRNDLSKTIWSHDETRCITQSQKMELDTNLGRCNPRLSFQLYPYGESEDYGKFVTMIVRINTSDKCPPLPSSSKVHMSLVVRADSSDKESNGDVLHECCAEEYLHLGFFRIHKVVSHDKLKECHSKHIYLEVKATCSGTDQ